MLIKNAFDILQQASLKIIEFGVQTADLNSTPKQARVISQLNESARLYNIIMKHIILNDDGDAIAGTIGQIDDDLNTLLLRLKRVAQLTNPFPVVPTPLHSFVTNNGDSSVLPSPANEGDLLYFHNGSWTNLGRGNPGESLVSTPSSIGWVAQVGNGIPSGGTTGQVLRKIDNTSYNVQWASLTPTDIGVSASAAELNILDGALLSTDELNTLVGINTGSSLADQLSAKQSTTLTNGNFLVGNGSDIATSVTPTGDVVFSNTGVFSISSGVIVDGDISGSAAIGRSKLAPGNPYRIIVNDNTGVMSEAPAIAASRVLVSNANGTPVASNTSTTVLGYLDISTSLQATLNNKLTVSLTSPAQGAMLYYNGTNWVNFAIGTAGQVLTSTGSIPQWGSAAANGLPTGGTTNQYLRKIDATNYNTEWHTFVLADVTDVVTSVTELNLLSGLTATAAVLNNVDISTPLTGLLNNKLDNNLSYHSIWIGGPADTAQQVSAGADGSVLTIVSGHPVWQTPPSPTGVLGPGSSTDNAIARWNGTGGDSIQNSGIIIDDSDNITGVTTLSSGQISVLNQAAVRLYETGSTNYVAIRASGVMGADYTITLPAAAPSASTFLSYDGANYVWAAGGGGGSLTATYVGYGDGSNVLTGEAAFTYDATNNILNVSRVGLTAQASDPAGGAADGQIIFNSVELDLRALINGEWTNLTRPALKSIDNTDSPYTLQEAERNFIVKVDTTAGDVTINIDSGNSIGYAITFINIGTGNIILNAGSATLNAVDTTCSTQYGWVAIACTAANEYAASGALGSGGGGGSGTVTSVAMSVPSFLSVAGSPITTSGTLAVSLSNQTANTVFSGPTGGAAAAPTFRALVSADIPDLSSIYQPAGTYVASVSPTANRISIGGTATVPIVDISSSYIGQASITTLGTITTGTWNATVIGAVYGGTGQNAVTTGDLLYGSATNTWSRLAGVATGNVLISGGVTTAPSWGKVTSSHADETIWKVGGNNLSGSGSIGSTSAQNVVFITNNTTRGTISSGGKLTWSATYTTSGASDGAVDVTTSSSHTTGSVSSYGVRLMPTVTGGASGQELVGVLIRPTLATGGQSGIVRHALRIEDSSGVQLFRVSDTTPTLGFGSASTPAAVFAGLNGTASTSTSATGLNFFGALNASNATVHRFSSSTITSANVTNTFINGLATYQFASGTSTNRHFVLEPTLNFTSTYVGLFYGILYNPSITFATGVTHYGIVNVLVTRNGVGAGATPTAQWHIGAGTTAAGTAPLKFTSGTNMTTPEDGAVEYNGSNLLFSVSTTRYTIPKTLVASATLDFPDTAAQSSADLTIALTGAAVGDKVVLGVPDGDEFANTCWTAFVAATDLVTVRFNNYDVTNHNPTSGTFKISVIKD